MKKGPFTLLIMYAAQFYEEIPSNDAMDALRPFIGAMTAKKSKCLIGRKAKYKGKK